MTPLEHPTLGNLWYKALSSIGYGFGPAFQKLLEVESLAGRLESRSRVSLTEPSSAFQKSPYPMHPYILFVEDSPPSLDIGPDSGKPVMVTGASLGGIRIIPLLESNGFHCTKAFQGGTTESVHVSVAKPSTDPTALPLDLSVVSLADTKVTLLDPNMKAALKAFS